MIVADSTPYAWPYDGEPEPARTALVVCGSAGEWATQTPADGTVETNIDLLRSTAAEWGALVVLVRQPEADPACGRPLQVSVELVPTPSEEVVVAAGIDGFYGSPLDALLRRHGRTHLLFAGRGFETTIHSTLRRANDRGYECLTIADACATLDPRMRAASISTIEMSGGIFGAVATTASVVSALEGTAPESDPEDDREDDPVPDPHEEAP